VFGKWFDTPLGYVIAGILALAFISQWILGREEEEQEVELQSLFGGTVPAPVIVEKPATAETRKASPIITVRVREEIDSWNAPVTGVVFGNVGDEAAYHLTPSDFRVGKSTVSLHSIPILPAGKESDPVYPDISDWNMFIRHDLAGRMLNEWSEINEKEINFPASAEYTNHNGSVKFIVTWDFKLFPLESWLRRRRREQVTFTPDTRRPHLVADNFQYTEIKQLS